MRKTFKKSILSLINYRSYKRFSNEVLSLDKYASCKAKHAKGN